MPPSLADLAAKVLPAVVSIASTDPVTNNNSGGGDDNGGDGSAYHPSDDSTADTGTVIPPPKAVEALGSGFVFDPAGYIITNNHVIDGASSVTVTFQDGTILPATIIGRDKAADLAVLKVDAGHKLPFLTFGDSGKMRVGDWVMAIGNPFGLPGSTSAGIVSALNRNINSGNYDDFIQTDATINRGNSGGPLFDMDGDVIGVNSAIYSPSGASDGIGFAIPSAMVAPVAQALKTNGGDDAWLARGRDRGSDAANPEPAGPAEHVGRADRRGLHRQPGGWQIAAGRRAGLAGRRAGRRIRAPCWSARRKSRPGNRRRRNTGGMARNTRQCSRSACPPPHWTTR